MILGRNPQVLSRGLPLEVQDGGGSLLGSRGFECAPAVELVGDKVSEGCHNELVQGVCRVSAEAEDVLVKESQHRLEVGALSCLMLLHGTGRGLVTWRCLLQLHPHAHQHPAYHGPDPVEKESVLPHPGLVDEGHWVLIRRPNVSNESESLLHGLKTPLVNCCPFLLASYRLLVVLKDLLEARGPLPRTRMFLLLFFPL